MTTALFAHADTRSSAVKRKALNIFGVLSGAVILSMSPFQGESSVKISNRMKIFLGLQSALCRMNIFYPHVNRSGLLQRPSGCFKNRFINMMLVFTVINIDMKIQPTSV